MSITPTETEILPGELSFPVETPQNQALSSQENESSSVFGSPEDTSPDGSILELANQLSTKFWVDKKDVVAYREGEIVLHEISEELLRKLVGVDDKGNIVYTGLRFFDKKTSEGKAITSNPNFHAKEIIPKETDPDQTTWGKIDVIVIESEDKEEPFTFTIGVEQFNTGSTKVFNITIIPDANFPIEYRNNYYKITSENLKNPQEPDYMI